jgi:hypothetical protein
MRVPLHWRWRGACSVFLSRARCPPRIAPPTRVARLRFLLPTPAAHSVLLSHTGMHRRIVSDAQLHDEPPPRAVA